MAPRLHAETRLALILANKDYAAAVGSLVNPHNDAELLAAALARHGFEVAIVREASRGRILGEVERFAAALGEAGPGAIGFFYYSGHGAARPNTERNYLIPITVRDASTSALWHESVPLEEVRGILSREAPRAAHIVVFDACRNELKLSGPFRTASKGLRPVARLGGMLTAFSADAEQMASDGDPGDGAGPYAQALALELDKAAESAAGASVQRVFSSVRVALRAKGLAQEPIYSDGLDREVTFAGTGGATPVAAPAGASAPEREALAQAAYDRVKDSGDPVRLDLVARRFPDTFAGELAKLEAAELRGKAEANGAALAAEWERMKDSRDVAELTAFLERHRGSAEAAGLIEARLAELRPDFRRAQTALKERGLYRGAVDGDWGAGSKTALERFQRETGFDPADGVLTEAALAALMAAPAPLPTAPVAPSRETLSASAGIPELRIGVLGSEDSAQRLAAMECLKRRFEAALDVPVKLVASPDYGGVIDGLADGTLDFAELGASGYAATYLRKPGAVTPLFTTESPEFGSGYYSVVVARADSGINSLDDLRGKVLGYADPNSTSGFLVPSVAFAEQGLDDRYFGKTVFSGGHEQGVLSVLHGDVDAAVTWSSKIGRLEDGYAQGALRKMVDNGLLDMSDIRIVWSSPQIKNGPFVLRSDLPEAAREKIRRSLQSLPSEDLACLRSVVGDGVSGLVPVSHADYELIIDARRKARGE